MAGWGDRVAVGSGVKAGAGGGQAGPSLLGPELIYDALARSFLDRRTSLWLKKCVMKSVVARLKPVLRWCILGAAIFFLLSVLRQHWQSVATIRIDAAGWACVAIALGLTLGAHICAAWVWSGLLRRDFQQPIQPGWIMQAYLQTNIAKYIPGNIWHYYGRINAARQAGASLAAATVTVALEPLLMAAAALLLALFSSHAIANQHGLAVVIGQWSLLVLALCSLHPKVINPVVQKVTALKRSPSPSPDGEDAAASPPVPVTPPLTHYPVLALLGNLGFVLLRGVGFLLTFAAIRSFSMADAPLLISAFSVAWLLGLVVPGAPGGLGIFEATAIALLGHQFAPGLLLGIVALYRLVSVTTEGLGAGFAWLDQRWNERL